MLYIGEEDGVRVDLDRWADPVIINNLEFEVRLVENKLQLTHKTKVDNPAWLAHHAHMASARSNLLACETRLQNLMQNKLSVEEEIMSTWLTNNEIRGLCIQLPDLYLALVDAKRLLNKAQKEVDALGPEPSQTQHVEHRVYHVPDGERVLLSLPTGDMCAVLFLKLEANVRVICPEISIKFIKADVD
jgi:hypothetical protein